MKGLGVEPLYNKNLILSKTSLKVFQQGFFLSIPKLYLLFLCLKSDSTQNNNSLGDNTH